MSDMQVLDSVWFGKIGIVLVDTGFEKKTYIGQGFGEDKSYDELVISQCGMPYPLQAAEYFFPLTLAKFCSVAHGTKSENDQCRANNHKGTSVPFLMSQNSFKNC